MKKGDIITIIGLNGFGMCNRAEFKYYGEINGQQAVTENQKGARKKFVMPKLEHTDKDRLTFDHQVPNLIEGEITRPSESGMVIRTMTGDCTIKIYGTVDEVKELVAKNLNQDFTSYGIIFALDRETDARTQVFPEQYVPGTHAPIDRELARQ